tara:strand:+ start:446 stop:1192 length:747 start_codon:yes stop_codon:yes gene_type:complete
MSVTNDPNDVFTVFTDGETEPQWFYDVSKINLVKTDKDVTDSKQFPKGSLVLGKDGFVRRVRKKGFDKTKVPPALIAHTVRDGTKCCTHCVRVFPISHFVDGQQVRSDVPTARCSTCRKIDTSTRTKPGTVTAERRAYVDKRRLEIIKGRCGCQWSEGCAPSKILAEMSDEYIMLAFEFNHIDDRTRIQSVSNYAWFTDSMAEKHGFETWKDLWEAEAAKCEILCKGHHGMHTKHQRTRNRKRAYKTI